jgi:hypothetical protein
MIGGAGSSLAVCSALVQGEAQMGGRVVAVKVNGVRANKANDAMILDMAQRNFELMCDYLGFDSDGDIIVKLTMTPSGVQDIVWEGINGGWLLAIDDDFYAARRAEGITIPLYDA